MKFRKLFVLKLLSKLVLVSATAAELPPLLPSPAPPVPQLRVENYRTFGQGVPLNEFLRTNLGDRARRSYFIAPDINASQLMVDADFSRYKRDIVPMVKKTLNTLDLSVEETDGVLFITKRKPQDVRKPTDDHKVFLYTPRHRGVSGLIPYLNIFPDIQFSYAPGLTTRAPRSGGGSTTGSSSDPFADSPMAAGSATFSQTDKDPSFILAKGSPPDLAKLKQLLGQLDVKLPQARIKTFIYEVRTTQNKESGVSLIVDILNGRLGLTLGSKVSTGDSLKLGLPHLNAAVSALAQDSRVRLLSSPVLQAIDGATAEANIGTETPTLGSVIPGQNGAAAQQSVVYQQAGVILSVSPRIFEDDMRLTISQELSSFVPTDTGLSSTPTKLRRSFKSEVVGKDGEIFLLGGLTESSHTDASSGQFWLFGNKSKAATSSEIVVLIQLERF